MNGNYFDGLVAGVGGSASPMEVAGRVARLP